MKRVGASKAADAGLAKLDSLARVRLAMAEKLLMEGAWEAFYNRVRWAVREMAMANPALDFNEMLFVRRHWPSWGHQCSHRVGEAQVVGADLCVLPTWRDPCPLVVLESLACGTPVLTTRGAGNAHLIDAGSGAVLEGPDDAALGLELRAWMARVRAGDIEPDAVRARVAGRGAPDWLAALEREVAALAG